MPKANSPLLAVSMGDPAGIGCEIILKASAALSRKRGAPSMVIIGDIGALRAAARRLGSTVPEPYEWTEGSNLRRLSDGLAVLNASRLPTRAIEPARPSIAGANAAHGYIIEGCRMTLAGEAGALVTAPINKEWLNRAGHQFPGHSELIADFCGVKLWRMMFVGEHLRVTLATVHIGLTQIVKQLTRDGVFNTIRLLNEHLDQRLGIKHARIAVLGLNPHAGENGLFGDEEARLITPAIKQAQRAGIDAFGPLAPDTAFIRQNGKFGFDGAVAMYHDQGLIPLKTLEFDRAVNITLGLPFIRTSPDHGTAYDIAGRGTANANSMIAALEYAAVAARRRLEPIAPVAGRAAS